MNEYIFVDVKGERLSAESNLGPREMAEAVAAGKVIKVEGSTTTQYINSDHVVCFHEADENAE